MIEERQKGAHQSSWATPSTLSSLRYFFFFCGGAAGFAAEEGGVRARFCFLLYANAAKGSIKVCIWRHPAGQKQTNTPDRC